MASEVGTDAAAAPTRILDAQCLCKAVHFAIAVPAAKLPLPVHMCHCTICRLTHGAYSCFHAPLPAGVVPQFIAPSSRAALIGYRHPHALATRYFCATCGCHIGDEDYEDGDGDDSEAAAAAAGRPPPEWRVASSIFGAGLHDDGGPDQAFSLRSHACTVSSPAGFHQWLPRLGGNGGEGRKLGVWNPPPDDTFPLAQVPYVATAAPEQDADGRPVLRAACYCGGVSFTIARPSDTDAEDGRYAACLDTCDDCRLVSGAHAVGWVNVPVARTSPRVPLALDQPFGTLVRYESSPGNLRGFCGVCGATTFFSEAADRARGVLDVSAALLRAPEGVDARNWVSWRAGRIVYLDSGRRYHRDFADGLRQGFDAWIAETYGGGEKRGAPAASASA